MRVAIVPRTRWGRIRMIAIISFLPLLFLVIWLFTIRMPGPAFAGPLPPLTPNQVEIRAELQRHVKALAHDIGVRSDRTYSNVLRASAYIERRLQGLGYDVVSQEFDAGNRSYRNIEATLAGVPGHAHEVVVLGAHYDTAENAPGADDNASGVAGVLELARVFAKDRQARTVRFVFFPNEEPPSFPTADMGSRHYATAARARNDQIVAMLSIESIGYYDTEKGSQRYPFPLNLRIRTSATSSGSYRISGRAHCCIARSRLFAPTRRCRRRARLRPRGSLESGGRTTGHSGGRDTRRS